MRVELLKRLAQLKRNQVLCIGLGKNAFRTYWKSARQHELLPQGCKSINLLLKRESSWLAWQV